SYAFGYLRQLAAISFQNVIIDSIDQFAFSSLLSDHRGDAGSLSINFTTTSLENTTFHPNALSNIGRATTISLDSFDHSHPKEMFVPTEEAFGLFLKENRRNKLRVQYQIDCDDSP